MHLRGKRKTEDAGVVNDDEHDGQGAEKIETGLTLPESEARIKGGVAQGAHTLPDTNVCRRE